MALNLMSLPKTAIVLAFVVVAAGAQAQQLTAEKAREIVAPFYQALTAGAGVDAAALVLQATTPVWVSCGGNDKCVPRDRVAQGIAGLTKAVPDLKWEIRDILVAGDRVIVRGQATGTPAGAFRGVPYNGKSMAFMSIDIHTIKGDKLAYSYHVEDWAGALAQLAAK